MADTPMIGTAGRALAVSYLRVSTKEQAEKGGLDEGYSIPAQRAANHKKAEDIGALIVEEFVDAGESARKADRPALQAMLDFVAHHHISYCIVHKVDRLARNRADDVTIHVALQQAGVMLVSATENIDETPSGMLLHGIMSTIAEFYSRNLATEVVKGMTQKAKTGGTPRKAPLGYINVQIRDPEGRQVRTVKVDEDRAPLVAWAFQTYASGNWTVMQLRDELTRRGLTTLATPKHPSKPLAKSYLYKMLSNPYYKGDVVYRDQVYKGSHTPLVPPEVYYQVQAVLAAHSTAAVRTQTHDHYLKGSLYCGHCLSRLILTHAKSSSGNIYPYFICSGRQRKATDCQLQAIHVATAERLVADYYTRLFIPAPARASIRATINAHFDALMASAHQDLETMIGQKRRVEAQQDRLLDAHLDGALSRDVMARKQQQLEERLAVLDHDIAQARQDYAPNRQALDEYLTLLADPQGLYRKSNESTRQLANQVFFPNGMFITENPEATGPGRFHLEAQIAEPFASLRQPVPARHDEHTSTDQEARGSNAETPDQGERLNCSPVVQRRGIEPGQPHIADNHNLQRVARVFGPQLERPADVLGVNARPERRWVGGRAGHHHLDRARRRIVAVPLRLDSHDPRL